MFMSCDIVIESFFFIFAIVREKAENFASRFSIDGRGLQGGFRIDQPILGHRNT